MKSKQRKRSPHKSNLTIKLNSWKGFIDEAFQLEALLRRKPTLLQIEFVGSGEIPSDAVLLMRSMFLKRSARTRIITHARSSLQGSAVLLWLLGDTRLIREDARIFFRSAGPFAADKIPNEDRSASEDDPLEAEDYIRVLHGINEFLPVKELADRPVEVPVLKEFGLVENEKVDVRLATVFARDKGRGEKQPTRKQKKGLNIPLAE